MITKEIIGDELYLYRNGILFFKKWISQNRSVVFDVMTYDKHTLISTNMKQCPNCLQTNNDNNLENHCTPCYTNIFLNCDDIIDSDQFNDKCT
jgi:hypothetical protein|tara:strand:+ start:983 stop:1261 length:279 start_codon:yes stop_codon:yes gene_type:complete